MQLSPHHFFLHYNGLVGSADVRDLQMAGALRRPPASPGCRL